MHKQLKKHKKKPKFLIKKFKSKLTLKSYNQVSQSHQLLKSWNFCQIY